MLSKMAEQDIEALISEGCVVHPSDVIRLNALALKIEKRPDFRLASLPRIAVIGDVIFRQPTIAQDIFLDDASAIVNNDPASMLALEAYVLANPDGDYEKLKHPLWFRRKCAKWLKEKLGDQQATEVRRALDFCLYGVDPRTGETPVYMSDVDIETIGVPDSPLSKALRLWFSATTYGMDSVATLKATSEQLEAMLERAYYLNEMMSAKDEEKQATAEYFATLEDVKKRAYAERDEKMKKENQESEVKENG